MDLRNELKKEIWAYPVSITLLGIIAIIITSERGFVDILIKIILLLLAFTFLTWFNTHYFRWFRNKKYHSLLL